MFNKCSDSKGQRGGQNCLDAIRSGRSDGIVHRRILTAGLVRQPTESGRDANERIWRGAARRLHGDMASKYKRRPESGEHDFEFAMSHREEGMI